jgi:2,3-bisphosphoglycerate-dependent phosphoglycerate mutase
MLRTFTMKRCFLFVLLLGLFVAAAPAQSIIFVVRHAEKMDNAGNDPDLADAGRARAERLAKMLKDAGISAVYTTEFKRTQQTAAPLAKALGLNVAILPAKDTAALIAKLHDLRAGNTLVVGHSNTIPDLIKAFGITTSISIAENDYDNLFMVVLEEKPRLIHLHY